jgi:uncharacterized protein
LITNLNNIMMKKLLSFVFALALAWPLLAQNPESEQLKIVFQLTSADSMAHKALMKQLGNITTVEPSTMIEVVCHGPGLEMLRNDKSVVAPKIAEFVAKGIVFNACEFSMKERNVSRESILPGVKYVKAGIIYIVRKQNEGWSYIKAG